MFVFEHGSEDRMKRSRLQWHYRTVLLVRIDWSRGLRGRTRLKSRELPTILTSARVCLYSERILYGHPSNERRLDVHLPLRFTARIEGSRPFFNLIADMPNYGRWLPGSDVFGGTTLVSPYPVTALALAHV
jgi:hypothetical protein